jgi:hypothetical protein
MITVQEGPASLFTRTAESLTTGRSTEIVFSTSLRKAQTECLSVTRNKQEAYGGLAQVTWLLSGHIGTEKTPGLKHLPQEPVPCRNHS